MEYHLFHRAGVIRSNEPRGISPKLLFHGAGLRFYHGKYRLPREIHEMDIISRGRGFDSNSDDEFVRFLRYALRSATEVQSHLYVAVDQGYISGEDFDQIYEQATEVKKMISGFIKYLRS